MKKLFLSLLALLLMAGVSVAASVPEAVDPVNGPEVWVTSVYNNSGSTLSAGDVVVWDIASSTGDNDNYVTTTTTTDTGIVAGVVWPAAIVAGASGSIAIRGAVTTNTTTPTIGANTAVCTGATAGKAAACGAATDGKAFGFVTQAGNGTSAVVFVNK